MVDGHVIGEQAFGVERLAAVRTRELSGVDVHGHVEQHLAPHFVSDAADVADDGLGVAGGRSGVAKVSQ